MDKKIGVVRQYLLKRDIMRHPNYNGTTLGNDFALVFLPDPMISITPVELNDDPNIPKNSDDPLEVFGWEVTGTFA